MDYLRNERGFTLIEMLVAMILVAVVVAAFVGLVTTAAREWGSLQGQADVQQHPRVAVSRLVAEIRQARDFVIATGGTALGLVKATVLTANSANGATSIVVEDASVLRSGSPIVLISLNRVEQVTATGIAGNTVTVSPALTYPHKTGEQVRRAPSALSVAGSPGNTTVAVASGSAFQTGDPVAVGDEGPFTVTGISGNILTLNQALTQSHPIGEIVQPLAVVFQCESGCPATGAQVTRCAQGCNTASNRMVLADLLAAPSGRQMFASTRSTLTAGVALGATQLCVQSVSGFAVNDRVLIDRDIYGPRVNTAADRRTVTVVDSGTNCLTVDQGVLAARAAGALVRVAAVDVNILATQFNDVVQQTQEVAITSRATLRN